MWNPHFKVLISLETVWEAGRWLRAEWGQGYRRNQPRHSPVLRVSLLVSLTFGFIPSLKILSATSVVQQVSRLPSGRGLSWWGRSGDRYYPSGLISPLSFPFSHMFSRPTWTFFFFFSRELCLGHLGDYKLSLSPTNQIFFFLSELSKSHFEKRNLFGY